MNKDRYVSLAIKDKRGKEITLENIIAKNKLSIILGTPGSGKSTLLKHYEEQNEDAKFLTIKEFLRLNISIEETIKVLLLDGIDEYRAVSPDKTFVTEEIADKINKTLSKSPDLRIVLTCRKMDWPGTDQDKLEKHINEKVGIFYLQDLNKNQQIELAKLLDIENQDKFLKQFQDSNFLTNPQLFCMLAEIWKNSKHHFSSKREIYETFIKCATKEKNETHKDKQEPLEDGEGLKLLGYLSYFYFFCGVDEFKENILEQVAGDEKGYTLDKLKQLLKTNLFVDYKFRHKTIAEFALAHHMQETRVKFKKIQALFVDKGHSIHSKLRGAYAWLCSLSEDMRLIKIDPYYQAIYGDNSSFDTETKKKVLQAVREYSQENPYFINFSQRFELAGFYEQDLDEFLQSEYEEAIKLNNHYIYFLNKIITQAHSLSSDMEEFIKKQILDNEISHYYKTDFLEYLGEKGDKEDKKILKEVLDSIVEKKIDDKENSLKDLILNFLYPEIIKPEEVIKYILSYGSYETNTVYMHYFYLLKEEVPFENKKTLVQKILENRNKIRHKKYFYLPYYIDVFIKDFFSEAYLKLSVEELYKCLWDFKQKFYEHESIKIEAYGRQRMEEGKEKSDELQCKSNKLFKINVREQIKSGDMFWLYNIYNFPYCFSPTNKSDVFLSQLKSYKEKETRVTKKELFLAWINSLPQDKRLNEDTRGIAKENGLEKEYKEYMSKEGSRIKKLNQQDKDEQNKRNQKMEKNEEILGKMEIEQINDDLGIMSWITKLYLFNQSNVGVIIKKETFENKIKDALCCILSNFPDYIRNSLTIKELSKNPRTMTMRDSMFYASLCVHTEKGKFLDLRTMTEDFKKYLYMVALWYEDMQYVPKTDFIQLLEEKDSIFATETLKEYIGLLIDTNFKPPLAEAMKRYINQQEEIGELKKFIKFYGQTTTFNKFLKHFMASHEQLFEMVEEFSKSELLTYIDEESRKTVEALKHLNNDDNEYDIDDALLIFSFFELDPFNNKFQSLDNSLRIKILTYIMHAFSTEKALQENKDTYMGIKDKCILFLKSKAALLVGLVKEELECLFEKIKGTIWENTFLSEINRQENKEEVPQYQIKEIKEMVLSGIV